MDQSITISQQQNERLHLDEGEVQRIFVKPVSFFELFNHSSSTKGSLTVTNYRLLLYGKERTNDRREYVVSVPLFMLDSMKKKQPTADNILLKISTKSFRFFTIVFENQYKEANVIFQFLSNYIQAPKELSFAFAFSFRRVPNASPMSPTYFIGIDHHDVYYFL
jgi:hypothetical protein